MIRVHLPSAHTQPATADSAGHAPGRGRDWIASRSPLGYGSHNGVTVTDNCGLVVAVAIGDVPELDALATARLIAAAPDLLEVAEHIDRTATDIADDMVVISGLSYRLLRAAISKATGQ